MTDTEAEILDKLTPAPGGEPKPFHLRALGGHRGSGLSVQVSRMVLKGWVSRSKVGGGPFRPVFTYRITAAGRQALANHRVTSGISGSIREGELAQAKRRFGR